MASFGFAHLVVNLEVEFVFLLKECDASLLSEDVAAIYWLLCLVIDTQTIDII